MYESVGYGTYDESEAFPNGIEAQLPVEESIPRGWQPYEYENSTEGYELAKVELSLHLKKMMRILQMEKKCMKYIVLYVTDQKVMAMVF